MEDEGFVDDDFIEDVAREYVVRYGLGCFALISERAKVAERAGDFLTAQTWQEIAATAERILS